MPLPQQNLDDKTFETLVEEATKIIPRRQVREWTDHNQHDPGITFIELFAWLAEMQGYYLNQLKDENYLKFLKLLGLRPKEATSARADLTFSFNNGTTESVLVSQGTKLTAEDADLVFETEESLLVVPTNLEKVLSSSRTGLGDNTEPNRIEGLSFFAFGEEAETRSRLYLGFQVAGFDKPFPEGKLISITFNLFEDYPVPRGGHGDEPANIIPSALIVWEYYNGETWAPLEWIAEVESIIGATTKGMPGNEPLCFEFKTDLMNRIKATELFQKLPTDVQAFIEALMVDANTVSDLLKMLTNPSLLLLKKDETLMLSQSGRLFFTAPSDMAKRVIHPFTEELFWLRATVRQDGYELSPKVDTITLNTVSASQRDTKSFVSEFSSNGKANQSFEASSYLPVKGSNVVQVREKDGRWKDWELKENLDESRPNDLHYTMQKKEAESRVVITFGDDEKGMIPSVGENHIRLISYLPEFEDRRTLGRSNGLPSQIFALDQGPVVAESLVIQVEEKIKEEPFSRETKDITCLVHLERTVPTRVRAGDEFEVKITIEAKQDLSRVEVKEFLHGDLRADGEKEAHFSWETVQAGKRIERRYPLTAGVKGGSIRGEITIDIEGGCEPLVVEEIPRSIVKIGETLEDLRWRDWVSVDDFDASKPDDPHYALNSETGEIRFGNGVNGDSPQVPEDQANEARENIRVISYQIGGGEAGNVKPDAITEISGLETLKVTNRQPASGGTAKEELEAAQTRARKDLKTRFRAITSEDFESLARDTPGLRVARAKAIPLFSPGLGGYPENKAEASVTVVVVPFSRSPKPIPSGGFLQTVCRHLEKHRLITTQLHVIPPDYVQVNVQATVLLQTGFQPTSTQGRIEAALNQFTHPLEGGPEGEGWPFGRTVYKSEIYQQIENVEGVDCVERVTLTAEGIGIARDTEGNISIPPQSLVYSGDHQIEIISPDPTCRVK